MKRLISFLKSYLTVESQITGSKTTLDVIPKDLSDPKDQIATKLDYTLVANLVSERDRYINR